MFFEWSLQLWLTRLKPYLMTYLSSYWTCSSTSFKESSQINWLKHTWLPIIIYKILINSTSFINDYIKVIIMWHLTSLSMKNIISRSIKRFLFFLLLASILLSHQNPFDIILPITSFTELLFQYISINVKDVMSQIISVKTAQNLKSTN